MSKTFEELRSDYNRGFWSVPETDGLQAQQNAGIAAVIMAVRGVIDQAYSEGRASKVRGDNENVQRQWVDALINEILGDAGNEKVAEGPLPHLSEREKALFVAALKGDAGPITPPATDPCPDCGGRKYLAKPSLNGTYYVHCHCPKLKATDPAPAVCEWTLLRAGSDLHTTVCGKAIWRCNEHAGVCPYCKSPIKFTEAK